MANGTERTRWRNWRPVFPFRDGFAVCISSSHMAYWVMHRTTLMLDDRKLAKARRLLRTKGIKDTIEAALDEVIAYEARRRAVDQLRNLEGLDLDDRKVMARAWR